MLEGFFKVPSGYNFIAKPEEHANGSSTNSLSATEPIYASSFFYT